MKAKSIMAFLVLSMVGSAVVPAQEISPNVVQEGRIWSLYWAGSIEAFIFTGINRGMFFGADTLIDGKTYKNVLFRRVFYWDNFDELPSYEWGYALREEGPKVYQYDYKLGKERLMFDFSLKPGDTVETYSKFVVTAVGVMEGEDPLHYIDLRDISEHAEGFDERWIEKVGSQERGIYWDDCWGCVGGFRDLGCCKETDEDNPFFIPVPRFCLSAEYTTVKGVISFVSLANLDSSTVWAVIDNTDTQEYAQKYTTLMRNSTPFAQKLVVDGVEYSAGDQVEITGWISSGYEFSDLEILSIRKKNTGVETSEEAELRILPNPAHETITVTATGCDIQKVEILDVNGRILYAATVNAASFRYNVSWMPSGIYLARVKTPCGVLTEKFSVK